MILFRLFTVIIVSFRYFSIAAQHADYYLPSWELGINAGGYIYQGDLTPNEAGSFKTIRPGVQLNAGKYVSNTFFIRAGLAFAFLQGNDHLYGSKQLYRYYRNYYFDASLAEVSATGLAYIFDNKFNEPTLQPYLAAGAGAVVLHVNHSSAATDFSFFPQSDLPARLAQDDKKNKLKGMMVLLSGAGLRYNLTKSISVNAEGMYRFSFSDYIDGFSIAANPKENDHYYSVNFGIIFRFADYGLRRDIRKKLRCP